MHAKNDWSTGPDEDFYHVDIWSMVGRGALPGTFGMRQLDIENLQPKTLSVNGSAICVVKM